MKNLMNFAAQQLSKSDMLHISGGRKPAPKCELFDENGVEMSNLLEDAVIPEGFTLEEAERYLNEMHSQWGWSVKCS